ncbi:MAG TPA: sigma factor-like helix-turn-helix DNA-binding protein, partial [Gaiellaceae bacterium]|nr:sigma factor-like helix-turn-helix DNA-binding protein [Gaiellaceae bacterium]
RQSQRRPNEVVYEEELAETVVDEDAITAEDIRRALGHLAFNQRSALVMRELEGRSYQEIAEILGTTVSAVETLIFRARRALREQLEEGITCHEAELAISKQLDGRLSRQEKSALRAHLRECDDCAGFARSQRAQRGALRSLAAIPLPQSLAGLFGGGSGGAAALGGGVAVKAAAIAAGAALATGVSYEGVKHGIVHSKSPSAAPAAVTMRASHSAGSTKAAAAAVVPRAQEKRHDQKPFRKAAVKARRAAAKRHANPESAGKPIVVSVPAHKVKPVPPGRSHARPVRPAKTHTNSGRHVGAVKPVAPKHHGKPDVSKSHGKKTPPPPPKSDEPPGNGHGKSSR